MVRFNGRYLVLGMVAVAALMIGASQAEAFWGCGWGCYQPVSYAYSSCYSPACVDAYCGNSWYLGCRPGPARRWALGPYRWYYAGGAGCYWGSCYTGSCCTSSCYSGCATDCGDTGCGDTGCASCVSGEATVAPAEGAAPTMPTPAPQQTPATPPAPAPMTPPALEPPAMPPAGVQPTTSLPTGATSGLLTVYVPANAKVYINGALTATEGSRRRYVSHGLQPGLTYKYEVRAEIVRNGRVAEDTKVVYLTAGASEGLAFGFNREPISSVAAVQ